MDQTKQISTMRLFENDWRHDVLERIPEFRNFNHNYGLFHLAFHHILTSGTITSHSSASSACLTRICTNLGWTSPHVSWFKTPARFAIPKKPEPHAEILFSCSCLVTWNSNLAVPVRRCEKGWILKFNSKNQWSLTFCTGIMKRDKSQEIL